ncbi:coiled-coil domain-containing protein 38-like [Pieris rapae]|uniref:coiled-coil domain-containing protein 38-like n=1 Tax=Pieris rapae TaxID=64459 RepID=UPI001E27ADE0|nr:coiled-coil domain-containing protein 38-like [Pieris rapae]
MNSKYRPSMAIEVKRPPQYKYEDLVTMKHEKKIRRTDKFFASKNVSKFNIPKEEIMPVRKLKRTNVLLPFKLFMKKQDSIRFKKRTAISIYDKHKIYSRNLENLSCIESFVKINTITDTDTCFFKCANGRPLIFKNPVFKSLKRFYNDYIRIQHEIAYKKDCILNIHINKRNEERIYDMSTRRVIRQVNYFDTYISEDYRNSMSLLTKWEQLEQKVDLKINELHNLANEMFSIKSRIISLDYQYSQQQKYGRFLYYLSPPTWRLNNREFARSVEIEAKGFDYGESHDEDTFAIIFEKLRSICFGQPIKPVLYFNYPQDLIEVFDTMENQQLHYLTHVTHLTPYIENLKDNLQCLKDIMEQDSVFILNSVKAFETNLQFYEAKCSHLKTKFYRILFGMFYESVGTLDVLKLQLHLEFCFEKVLLDRPLNMGIVSMAKHLESFFVDYSYRLDNIHSETVRRAVSKYQQMENHKMVQAKKASKELRLFNRLETQILRAHGFGFPKTSSSQKIIGKKRVINCLQSKVSPNLGDLKKHESLTADEIEYLALFTDWTENEDPAKYLQRLSR